MKRKLLNVLLAAVFSLLILFASSPVWAVPVDMKLQKEIEDSLVCQDGCGMIVSACENQTAEYMRKIIVERLAQGQSKAEIMGYFESIYGVKVLAAPPAKGFNVTAWVTPFIAIVAGGLLVYFAVDKWVMYAKLQKLESEDNDLAQTVDYSEYEEKLDEELKKYL
ncbi:MAG: cytochrome c-type biogenesis protein CcmH [Thermincola sp.]|jgi:cytochrome c-type biogenesis protein CcmH|nr:cytochrome c-type biogenesis protein CcmH [Thermincola sp.]MDT3703849.1 cytochrome c-type biogenesis protein CcmH [Thermincola sp.]